MREIRKDSKGRVLLRNESQLKNGSYCYRYFDERTGKRKSITSWRLLPEDVSPDPNDERECIRNMSIHIERSQRRYRRRLPTPSYTLNDFWAKYLELKCEISESTLVSYIYAYNKHIRNDIGKRLVTAIRESDVKRFYIKLLGKEGLSVSYVNSMSNLIEPVLDLAVKEGYIDINPAKGVMKGLRKRKDWNPEYREALTEKEQSALVDFVGRTPEFRWFQSYLTVFLGTGMRCGELCGLTWDDIDFENNMVSVNHTLNHGVTLKGTQDYYVTYPKSRKGKRDIPMLKEVREVFEELYRRRDDFNRDYQPVIDGYTNFIFRDLRGGVMNTSRINRALKNAINEYNRIEEKLAVIDKREAELLPSITSHHLRHTFCTRLIENGVNIKTVQYLMGHSYPGTTMKIYVSVTSSKNSEEMEKIEGKIKLK